MVLLREYAKIRYDLSLTLHPDWSFWHICQFCFFNFIDSRVRGRERERKKEKHHCERETLISCFLHAPELRTEPTTQACALTWSRTCDLSVCKTVPNQLSHTGQGCLSFCFNHRILMLEMALGATLSNDFRWKLCGQERGRDLPKLISGQWHGLSPCFQPRASGLSILPYYLSYARSINTHSTPNKWQ